MRVPLVHLCGLGAATPVGGDAWSSAAAIRAGISGFTEHPYAIDGSGERMRIAAAPWLDPDLVGVERFAALLLPAIEDALAPLAAAAAEPRGVALGLALPGPRPGLAADVQPALLERISAAFLGRFTGAAVFPCGHAAGLLALDAAARKLAEGAFDACVVAGVDCYLDVDTLEWLDLRNEVYGPGRAINAWNFLPSEAAGAVLLVRREAAERLGLAAMMNVLGCAAAFEPKRIYTDTVCIGEGLTAALAAALQGLPEGARVGDVWCDMNGQPYRADEYGFASLRVADAYADDMACHTPADCCGDVGAASGPLLAVLASVAARKGYGTGAHALLFCGSENGHRAAALLAAAPA